MAHELPPLPYPKEALEPHIDALTMEIHHDRHHKAYVDNLNKAIAGNAALEAKSLDALIGDLASVPDNIRGPVRNNGGGHWNHSFFWKILAPKAGGAPSGKLGDAIKAAFGSFADFQAKFEAAGTRPFRQRLGLARFQRRQAGNRFHRQPGQSAHGQGRGRLRRQTDPRRGRLGTCLLPEISEQTRRLFEGHLERDQLERSGKEPLNLRYLIYDLRVFPRVMGTA